MKQKIIQMNREFIIENSKKYKKIDYNSMACEEFELKEYFSNLNLANGRVKFRERCQTMIKCKMAHPSDYENIKSSFSCTAPGCDEIDMETIHWKTCIGYSNLRKNRNLDIDEQLCEYHRDIIQMRSEEK